MRKVLIRSIANQCLDLARVLFQAPDHKRPQTVDTLIIALSRIVIVQQDLDGAFRPHLCNRHQADAVSPGQFEQLVQARLTALA